MIRSVYERLMKYIANRKTRVQLKRIKNGEIKLSDSPPIPELFRFFRHDYSQDSEYDR